MECMTGGRPVSSANLDGPGKHRCISLLEGMGVTLQATFYIDPSRGNKMDENDTNKTEKTTKMTQQILHKSMFLRPRSHSLGTLPHKETPTQTNTNDNIHVEPSVSDSNKEQTNINTPWQNDKASTKRKAESSPEMVNKNSKVTKTVYTVTTGNRYEILDLANNEESNEQKEPKPPKPEPIFVTGVIDIKKLKELLSTIAETEKYTMTTLRSGHIVKIMPTDVDTYKDIRANFMANDVSHYTYKLKSERAYRVVLRGLHASEDTELIKQELFELGHEVRQITNVIHKSTKNPLPLFYVELEPKNNNKQIFDINRINRVKVSFEAPYKKQDILQCKRCQRFGHAKNQCNRPYRCVKCGEEHPTTSCLKRPDTDATCANCQEKHPASYKGCMKYKQYKDLLNKNKTKKVQDSNNIVQNQQNLNNPVESSQRSNQYKNHNYLKPNITYAQATNQRNIHETKPDIKESNNFTELLDVMFDKLQNIMKIMLDNMMDRMIQLVTSLIKHP